MDLHRFINMGYYNPDPEIDLESTIRFNSSILVFITITRADLLICHGKYPVW